MKKVLYLYGTDNIVKKLLVVLIIVFSSCERKLCPTYSSVHTTSDNTEINNTIS
ncbi:MAG: hypothetical protein VW741_03775 [Flammeovirgaceae bacterium]